MTKARSTLWKLAVAAAAAMVLGAFLLYYIPPLRAPLSIAMGRNHGCSIADAWRGWRFSSAERTFMEEYKKSAKIVREEGGLALWEAPGARYWVPKLSPNPPRFLSMKRARSYGAPEDLIRPGDTVLDCGAHVGSFTLTALEAGAARVVAIEPAPDNLECLRRNLADYVRAGRVIIYPKGVWDRDDWLPLRAPMSNSATYSVALNFSGGLRGPTVPLTTIDKIVAELSLPRVDFIKMNIQGAEAAALRGAVQTLRRYHPRLIITPEHREDDPETIPKLINTLAGGYRVRCGPCLLVGRIRLRPATLFFF
jgi:FkbM family methyltransferase